MRRHGDRLRVGVWRLEAGWRDRPDLLLAAAREASAAFDHPLAAALAEAAVDAGGGFEAELSLLHELPFQGKAEEAAGRADRLAAAAQDEASRIGVAELRARLQLVLGRTDRAHAILAEAILSASDPQDQDRLRGQQVSLAYSVGDIARAVAIGTSVVGRADARPTATAVYYVVRSMACAGRGEDALVIADRWLEPPTGPSGPAPTRYVTMARLQAMALSGRVADAVAVAEREVLEAMHGPKAATRPFWMHDLAHATLLAGRIGAARRRFLEVLSLMPLDGLPPSGRLWVLDGLAEAAALSGDTADAGSYVARLEEATPPWCTPLKRSGTIWEAAARGEITRARTLAVRYAARFKELGATMMQVWVLHDAMRLGAGREVAEDLAAAAARCQGPLPALMATNARALADGDADALDDVAGRFAELGYVLLAAESASEAARRYRAAGRPGRAASAGLRAQRWKALTDGARTPLLDAPVGSIGLTAREHEVAAMAATGLSDRDIAGRLQLSIRTVQSHLYRTYQKLGIPDRTELAPLFEPGERNAP
jgi:DNA-binding CsgD family transcriptional regulator